MLTVPTHPDVHNRLGIDNHLPALGSCIFQPSFKVARLSQSSSENCCGPCFRSKPPTIYHAPLSIHNETFLFIELMPSARNGYTMNLEAFVYGWATGVRNGMNGWRV